MFVLLGLAGWAGAALLMVGAWLGTRALVSRALGGRFGLVVGVAGPMGAYLVCALLFALAELIGGRGASSLVVDVRSGGPAEAAGILSGDRIVAVDDKELTSWDELMQTLRESRGPIRVRVQRSGQELALPVSLNAERRLGIESRLDIVPVGLGEALAYGGQEPTTVLKATSENIIAIVRGRSDVQFAGVGSVGKNIARAGRGSQRLWFFAAFSTYLWPGIWLIQGAFALDRRRSWPPVDESRLASRATRFYAFLVDAALFGVALGIGAIMGAATGARNGTAVIWMLAIGLVCMAVQWSILTYVGQTLGKRWFGLRVVCCDGSRAGFARIVVARSWLFVVLGYVPSFGGIPWPADAIAIFRRDRRCLHDIVAGTIVVREGG
jgi:uncharacterized RDD family membrane protein YckC